MKKLLIILLCISCYSLFGQEKYLQVTLANIKTTDGFITNAHLIKDDIYGGLSLFLQESKTTYGFQYDKNLKQTAQLTSNGLKRKYKEIIGQASENGNIRLIQKNNRGNKFASILYNFEDQTTEEMVYDLDTTDFIYLQSFTNEGICYVFGVLKNTNILKKLKFTVDGEVTSEDISLEDEIKRNKLRTFNLYQVLKDESGAQSETQISKVENKLPSTLNIATEQNKMYAHENGFYWTLDENHQYTALLDFQLPELSPKLTIIRKAVIGDANSVKTNSFISENVLVQIVSNRQYLSLAFKNLKTKEIFKEYKLSKDEDITFKNGPISQEGSVYFFGSSRQLEKTSKFLRKISTYKNGVALFEANDGYRTIIGGVREISGGGGGFGPMATLPIAGAGSMFVAFNPASFAYASYGSTSSTRIESLFDSDFQHIEGEPPLNVFDEIDAFSEDMTKRADDVYLIDDFVLFGNYQTNRMLYTLYKFENK